MAGVPRSVKAWVALIVAMRLAFSMNRPTDKAPDDRAARLAEQLRANLRKRKAQAREVAREEKGPSDQG